MIRTVLVDDEPVARRFLRGLLDDQQDFTVVDECRNGDEAVEAFRRHRPDVAFLDVQMPGMDGFEVLQACPAAERPRIVFVTAYDAYALRAFEVHALDYLLKPFDEERFKRTAERVRHHVLAHSPEALQARLDRLLQSVRQHRAADQLERFTVRQRDETIVVPLEQVDWIESEGNYVVLHCGRQSHLVRASLGGIEKRLPSGWTRIHRSVLVNTTRIGRLVSRRHGDYLVSLHDGTRLRVSRRYTQGLRSFLKTCD